MAIYAKVSLMNAIEKRLEDVLTASALRQSMSYIADVLEGFEIKETYSEEQMNEDLLEGYLSAMKVQGRSEKTIERYRYVIGKMAKSVGLPTRKVTVHHLRAYLAKEQERGLKDSTIEGLRQVFCAYFNWLQRESLIDKNPTANLGAIKCAKKKKQILSEVDLYKLKTNCKNSRDHAIVQFLASTGCRISEVTGLNREDINFADMTCVVHGKGNKDRTAFFDNVTAVALQNYLDGRKDLNPALFVNRYNVRLQNGGVREMLVQLAKRAGVEQRVHPHKFRRTLATGLARHGMPVQEVSFILGHEKIDTTMGYIVQNEEDVKSNYNKYAM